MTEQQESYAHRLYSRLLKWKGYDMATHIAKVFIRGEKQKVLQESYDVIEPYQAFLLIRASDKELKQLSKQYPVQDITQSYEIHTPRGVVKPNLAVRVGKKSRTSSADRRISQGLHHYLLQFIGPIKQSWLAGITRAGGTLRTAQNDFTWIVLADDKALTEISVLPYVRWVSHLPYEDRISPEILKKPGRQPGDPKSTLPRTRVLPGVYTLEFFGQSELGAALPKVKDLGFKVLNQDRRANLLVVESLAPAKVRKRQFTSLTAVHGIRFIRERVIKRSTNNVATGIICSDAVRGNSGLGLSGQGEFVGICDTGIDTGDAATINDDFAKRVAAIKSYPINLDFSTQINNPGANDGPADLDSGHGTHVAGSVLGSGVNSSGLTGVTAPIRGLAYKAKLIFQAVEQEMLWKPEFQEGRERYELSGLPNDLTDLFQFAYNKGARIHSNSWGGGEPGVYDQQCSQLDQFVWKHKDMCILVAAGNDGSDNDGDGKINPMSVTSPSTAKNCITIGASENMRPEFNADHYGAWWPDDYPVAPFKNAPMGDDPDQVVAFSSRGPTKDGRIKPDVLAPGTWILSTRSSQIASNNHGWRAFPASKKYFFMGGTSMATPLAAGAAILVREYYRKHRSVKSPTAALIKATLVAGATRIGSAADRKELCDSDQGFGRINLAASLAPAKPARMDFVEQSKGLRTGETKTFDVTVKSNKVPLRIVLAYTDFPGPALVNDLNLIVHSPAGKTYVGNQKSIGSMSLDADNNVEVVQVPRPSPGTWEIEIVGSNVPQGPQDFVLVYLGDI
jgi:subtilisin family serine protease